MVKESAVSVQKDKKDAPSRGSKVHGRKGKSEQLIRLDDLLPKSDVKGGRQLLFGATDTTETTNTKDQ